MGKLGSSQTLCRATFIATYRPYGRMSTTSPPRCEFDRVWNVTGPLVSASTELEPRASVHLFGAANQGSAAGNKSHRRRVRPDTVNCQLKLRSMSRLNGKVAVITGAGRGIGREYAMLFANEGAKVVVNDPGVATDGFAASSDSVAEQVADEIRSSGGEAVADTNVVGTTEAADSIVKTATDTFGRIDVLVNNAGILRDRTILKMSDEEWDDVIRVHLTGSFKCLRAARRGNEGPGNRRLDHQHFVDIWFAG